MGESADDRTANRLLSAFATVFLICSAVCFGYWRFVLDKARNELSEAAASGSWSRYESALRDEWPGLEWFIAALFLFVVALLVGLIALLYWTSSRRKRNSRVDGATSTTGT